MTACKRRVQDSASHRTAADPATYNASQQPIKHVRKVRKGRAHATGPSSVMAWRGRPQCLRVPVSITVALQIYNMKM